MGREENIIVFKDTENIYKKNARIKESVEKSIKLQKLILESDELKVPGMKIYDNQAKIVISKNSERYSST